MRYAQPVWQTNTWTLSMSVSSARTTAFPPLPVAMYMPANVQVTYGANYTDTEIGSMAERAAQVLQSFGGGDASGGFTKLLNADSDLVKNAGQFLLAGVGNLPGFGGAKELEAMKKGRIISNRMELAFKGIPKRSFQYNFKMIPKSAEEAEEIQKMIEARDKSLKKLMCAQHFRFRNESQSISNEVKSIYPVYHARSWMLRRNFFNVTKGFLQKKESGGGPCIDIGVHVLDLTLLFMGHPKPISVTGVSKTELAKEDNAYSPNGEYDKSSMDVEDFAAAFVKFENGASLIFEVSWMLHHKMPEDDKEDMQIWLYGKNGGMHWPSCEKLTTNSKEKKEINTVYKINTKNVIEPHALGCMEFANAVFNDIPVPVPAEHSYQVMQILNAIYESQKLRKEILL